MARTWGDNAIVFSPLMLYISFINLKFEDFLSNKMDDMDISSSEFTYYLLNIFMYDDLSQRELAKLAYVSESNVAKVLKKLESKDYIFREVDEANKSRKIIKLTKKGETVVNDLLRIINEWENELTGELDSFEVSDLKKKLYSLSVKSIHATHE